MDVDAYLRRIRYRGGRQPSLETLRDLHRAHMYTVPFENLDIHLGRAIVLNDYALYNKIVTRRRGGFCYELNGLFAALLSALGFRVDKLCARVARPDGGFGPPFDHMCLRVELERTWIADVGFGDSFLEPLALEMDTPQYQWGRTYRLVSCGEYILHQSCDAAGKWRPEYMFDLQPHAYPSFTEMCVYHQTSPESTFTRKRVCSRATPEGRITLSDLRWIETRGGVRSERMLQSEEEHRVALREFFGVIL